MKKTMLHILTVLLLSTALLGTTACVSRLPSDTIGHEETTLSSAVEQTPSESDGDNAPATDTRGETVQTSPDGQTTQTPPDSRPDEGQTTEGRPAEGQVTDPSAETDAPLVWSAPDFTMLDGSGNAVKLSDFMGKPIVLNFWASWCPPCKAEMPDFEEAYKQYGDDVVFIMLNLTDGYSETVATANAHIAANGYTFPVYYDTAYEGAYAYEVSAIPQTCFINARGQLVSISVGMIDGATLEGWIGRFLGE